MRALRFPYRRSLVPDEVLQGGVVHQLPAQREVWTWSARHDVRVRVAEMGGRAVRKVQSDWEEASYRSGVLHAERHRPKFVLVSERHFAASTSGPATLDIATRLSARLCSFRPRGART